MPSERGGLLESFTDSRTRMPGGEACITTLTARLVVLPRSPVHLSHSPHVSLELANYGTHHPRARVSCLICPLPKRLAFVSVQAEYILLFMPFCWLFGLPIS